MTIICPRCAEPAEAETLGMSRVTATREIAICGACCSDEAWLETNGAPRIEPHEWSTMRWYRHDGSVIIPVPR